ncbi:MAG: helix-turn-helix domain-containing protein [Desulfosalsimonadaceae bacterium]|nr:helix-turn-helix domain-containing protein [Desulfosalsimonadaceae bacterium]
MRVNISNLRHKLEKDASRPCYIVTESGVGYRFKGQT